MTTELTTSSDGQRNPCSSSTVLQPKSKPLTKFSYPCSIYQCVRFRLKTDSIRLSCTLESHQNKNIYRSIPFTHAKLYVRQKRGVMLHIDEKHLVIHNFHWHRQLTRRFNLKPSSNCMFYIKLFYNWRFQVQPTR